MKKIICLFSLLFVLCLNCFAQTKNNAKELEHKAENGDVAAMYNLGFMYFNGEGVTKNYTEAINWFKKAAEKGDTDAMDMLGNMYYNGIGVTRNYTEGINWLKKAAGNGDIVAMQLLGSIYYKGEGVTKNYTEAFKWFKKVAENGNTDAMSVLGSMYYNGEGVTKNYTEAFNWYKKAAENGDADAMGDLGSMYYEGKGITKNYTEAINWFKKAAENGNERAKKSLEKIAAAKAQEEKNKQLEEELKKKAVPGLAFAKQNLIGHAFYADASEFMKKNYTSAEAQMFLGAYTQAYSPYFVFEFVDEIHYKLSYVQLPKRGNISRATIMEALASSRKKEIVLYYYKNGAIYDEKDKIQLKYVNGTLVDPNGEFPTLKKAY